MNSITGFLIQGRNDCDIIFLKTTFHWYPNQISYFFAGIWDFMLSLGLVENFMELILQTEWANMSPIWLVISFNFHQQFCHQPDFNHLKAKLKLKEKRNKVFMILITSSVNRHRPICVFPACNRLDYSIICEKQGLSIYWRPLILKGRIKAVPASVWRKGNSFWRGRNKTWRFLEGVCWRTSDRRRSNNWLWTNKWRRLWREYNEDLPRWKIGRNLQNRLW